MGGAQVEGRLLFELDRVHGHHVLRSHHPGALDGVDADASDADDNDRVPRFYLGAVDGGPPTGGHPARDQGDDAEREVVVHLHQRCLVHDAVLGERAQLGHHVQVLALVVVPDGAVGYLPRGERRRAQVAQVRMAPGAHFATTADRKEARRHVVAHLEAAHARPHLEDDAASLVPAHHGEQTRLGLIRRRPAGAHVTVTNVLIGMAQSGGRPLDENLLGARRVEIYLFDLPILLPSPKHRRMRLHLEPPEPWHL